MAVRKASLKSEACYTFFFPFKEVVAYCRAAIFGSEQWGNAGGMNGDSVPFMVTEDGVSVAKLDRL